MNGRSLTWRLPGRGDPCAGLPSASVIEFVGSNGVLWYRYVSMRFVSRKIARSPATAILAGSNADEPLGESFLSLHLWRSKSVQRRVLR